MAVWLPVGGKLQGSGRGVGYGEVSFWRGGFAQGTLRVEALNPGCTYHRLLRSFLKLPMPEPTRPFKSGSLGVAPKLLSWCSHEQSLV